jgi:hypothetical protein
MFIINKIKSVILPIQRGYEQFANSLIGKKVDAALRFCVKENFWEAAGFYAGSALTTPIGRITGGALGVVAARISAMTVSGLAGHAAQQALPAQVLPSSPILQRILTWGVFAAGAYLASIIVTSPLESLGLSAGETVGEFIGCYGGGLLSAFLGMQRAGTKELLYSRNTKDTYLVKIALSMIGATLLSRLYPAPSPLLQLPLDFTIGSLLYNAKDLARIAMDLHRGRALDGRLSQQPLDLPLTTFAIDSFSSLSTTAISTSTLARFFPRIPPSILALLLTCTTPESAARLHTSATQHPFMREINNLMNRQLWSLIVRGFNAYEANRQTYCLFSKHPMVQAIQSALSSDLQGLAEYVTLKIRDLEREMIGFPISGHPMTDALFHMLRDELFLVLLACATEVHHLEHPLTSLELRRFYGSLARRGISFYEPRLGKTLGRVLSSIAVYQIDHSRP